MAPSLNRRDLLRAFMALPVLGAASAAGGESPLSRVIAAGRLYGAAVRPGPLSADSAICATVIANFDWLTPEIDWKWNALEYRRGAWWFERADALVDFARRHGKSLRGHTLLWDQSTPDWAKAEMAERRDWRLIERWFAGALARYGDAACEWDVINEPIDTVHGDNGLRRNCFHRAFGPDYIARALRLAQRHAPGTRLFINEYGLDYGNREEHERRRALLRLIEQLRHEGAPLDGVGVQAHLDLGKGPLDAVSIGAMIREIGDMGLSVTITELDVREADRSCSLTVRDRAIDDEVRRYLDIVLAEPAVRGVVSWGVSDRDSWLRDNAATSPDQLNRGLPFDAALRPKPVLATLRRALSRHA